MTQIYQKIRSRLMETNSRVCVGLDLDYDRMPYCIENSYHGFLEFSRKIIEATSSQVLAYKINTAFYEAKGQDGWKLLEEILRLIPNEIVTIADAKRGDIGSTAQKYAEAFFQTLSFDCITVSPYMGYDSVQPFLEYSDKGIIVLCLSSNKGSYDFQMKKTSSDDYLYEIIAKKVIKWHEKYKNCLLVVGGTHPKEIEKIRKLHSELFFLVPGVGEQRAGVQDILKYSGANVMISSSRAILYSSREENFYLRATQEVETLKDTINRCLL